MQIQFRDCPPLVLDVDDTPVANRWRKLFTDNVLKQPTPIFRDPQRYNLDRLRSLALEANQRLGWQWNLSDLGTASTTTMHKDIEQFLSQGFEHIPAEFDELMTEIHFCLHAIEGGSRRSSWLQVEWFNDDGIPMSADEYPAKLGMEFGDLRLLNPYVGHHPLLVYHQRDSANIAQTCRFHDLIRPGICFVVDPASAVYTRLDWDAYLDWFWQHAPDWVAYHGVETLKKFTGDPVIGRIRNLKDLEYCLSLPYLEIDRIEID
jgi:hypothetical protein